MPIPRSSGILLHPTALPGPFGIGDLGREAYRFVDFLAAARQTVWQVLPLGPTGYGDSPYSAFSAFAGNPLLISPELLVASGDLPTTALDGLVAPRTDQVDFAFAQRSKTRLLQRAAANFDTQPASARQAAFAAFCREQADWLDDYALFRVIRDRHDHAPWQQWPAPLRDRHPAALRALAEQAGEAVRVEQYVQFVFHEQWHALKTYANERGVQLLGDIPIFVAGDSADVWARRDLFQLDAAGLPLRVAGVPPDYFSAEGQRWGNPLFDWPRLQADDFRWWRARIRHNLALVDWLRIDHFRGFVACWSIPADALTAIHGHWEEVPGHALFTALRADLGELPLLAEDLGVITPEVEALRDHFGLPGMKILQFAFGSGPRNLYLPHNLPRNAVVYTGTHDNDTTAGWWQQLDSATRRDVLRYLGREPDHIAHALVRLAAASVATLCIIPLQDLLGLGSEARFNTPGQSHGNWTWRLQSAELHAGLTTWLAEVTDTYGRTPEPG